MREVTIYYAYDDTEFTDRDECIAYENRALNFLKAIDKCYSFFDKDMNRFFAPDNDNLEDWWNWVSISADRCEYIHRWMVLPDEVNNFVHYEFGYCIENNDFEEGLGLFRYDMVWGEWRKVSN